MYVKSEEQISDVFTKALSRLKVAYFTTKLGLKSKNEIAHLII